MLRATYIKLTGRQCVPVVVLAPVYSRVLSCVLVRMLGHKSVLTLVLKVQIEKLLGR